MYIDKINAKRLFMFISYREVIKMRDGIDCEDLEKRCIYILNSAYKDGYIIGYDDNNDSYYIHLR